MMRIVSIPLLIAVLFTLPAQSPARAGELDLKGLMKMALEKNADILVQGNERRIAGFQWWQSFSHMLPQMDAQAGYWETSERSGLPEFVAANGLREKIAWFSLQQTLFDAGTLLNISESSIGRKQQTSVCAQTRQEILLQVIEAYFTALKARDETKAFEDNLDAFDLLYQQSQKLYENGVVPELDVKKSRVEYLLQRNALDQSRKDYQQALDRIKELIGIAIEDSLSILDFENRSTELDSLPVCLRIARENRQELQILRLEGQRFRAEHRAALLQRLPSAYAGAYYGWDTVDPLHANNVGWQVYVNVSLPILHWGQSHLDRQIAMIRYDQTEVRRQQLLKQITQEVTNAYRDSRIQLQQMRAMEESRSEAEEAVRMAKVGYQEGTVTNLDVVNTQKLLMETSVNYLNALYDFFLAKARLYRSMGTLKEDYSWLQ